MRLYKAIKSQYVQKQIGIQFLFTGNRLASFSKGNRPLWRQRVKDGEIQLDRKPQSLLFLQPSLLYLNLFNLGDNKMTYNFTVLIEQGEDGAYIATVPSLKSCYTQADTVPELLEKIHEVIELCLEVEKI